MTIKVLAENTAASAEYGSEHGLSLYIETSKHKILFDTGASGLFAENAAKMQVDLSAIDLAVISHGHRDHGGGLRTFLERNRTAKVYIQERAFETHAANRADGTIESIGLDTSLLPNERFVFCGERYAIDEARSLFSGVHGNTLLPSGNTDLLMRSGTSFVPDDFVHEQNLLITDGGKTLLIAGCAHNGIGNILEHFHQIKGDYPDAVVGGFHLSNPGRKQTEDPSKVAAVGETLLKTGAQFYTCHCTGKESFRILQDVMGEKVKYISSGDQFTI